MKRDNNCYTVFVKIDLPSMFQGRIGVTDFWKAYAISFAISIYFGVINEIFSSLPKELSIIGLVLILLMLIPGLIVWLASIGLTVRRLHDLNLSGWWSLAPLALFVLPLLSLLYPAASLLVFILCVIAFLGFIVYLSFFPGKPTENKYGSQVKYDSWIGAYFNYQGNEGSRVDSRKTFLSKLSYDAVLIGGLVDMVGSGLLALALFPYLLSKYSFNLEDTDAFIQQFANLTISDPIAAVVTWGLASVVSILAGYIAARIANRNPLLNALVSSSYCILAGITGFAYLEWQYVLVGIIASPILTLIGGYIRIIQVRHMSSKG